LGSLESDHGAWANAHVTCPRAVPAQPKLKRPHIVLISVDTLRPDHLGLAGYPRNTSSNLDALAEESVVFENAFSPAPWTLPSHASMFTGHYPESHGAGYRDSLDALDDRLPTLAETLKEAGYHTVAFAGGGLMSRTNGLDRGFDSWTEHIQANLTSTLPQLFDALGLRPEAPVFLFLHTYDVHGPYHEMPSSFDFDAPAPMGDAAVAEAELNWKRIRALGHHHYQNFERFESLAEVVAAYDAGIRTTDEAVGRIFDRLRELGIYEEALIIVTSDHGESLYDRGLFVGHGFTLYDEDLRVPLIVRLPGASQVGRRTDLVDLVDLMPLVLDVAGVEMSDGLQGTSPLVEAGEASRSKLVRGETVFSGARFQRTVDWKFVSAPHPLTHPNSRVPDGLGSRFESAEQAYDLTRDPGEKHNLVGEGEMSPELDALRRGALGSAPPGTDNFDPSGLDPGRAAELRALGYLE
jgi:arylsulfatase A-like enzyme